MSEPLPPSETDTNAALDDLGRLRRWCEAWSPRALAALDALVSERERLQQERDELDSQLSAMELRCQKLDGTACADGFIAGEGLCGKCIECERLDRDQLRAEVERLTAQLGQKDALLRVAYDTLAAGEKLLPGVITTAGRMAIGDVAEARAERDALAAQLAEAQQALREIAELTAVWKRPHLETNKLETIREKAYAALAVSPGETDE